MRIVFSLKIRLRCCSIALLSVMFLAACLYAKNVYASSISGILTESIPGAKWKLEDSLYSYSSKSLYNYINGAADFFIAYGFIGLKGAGYVSADNKYLTIDIYDMGQKLNAFGVFHERKDSQADILNIGTESFVSEGYLVFYKNRYYIEIQSVSVDKTLLKAVAEQIAEKIAGDNSLPDELMFFPEKGKNPGSVRYVRGGILGHAFLDRGIICRYTIDRKTVTAFVAFFQSNQEAADSFSRHISFLKKDKNQCQVITGAEYHLFTSSEPYHKKIIEAHKGAFIVGIYDLYDSEEGRKLLRQILSRIP